MTKIVVLGDLILDRYVEGLVDRMSPEAPVPVLRYVSEYSTLGGAGNVAHNIVALGARSHLVGIVGDDEAGQTLSVLASQAGIEADLILAPGMSTVRKTRFMAGHRHLLRMDEEIGPVELSPSQEANLMSALARNIGGAGGLVISDYGKGCLSDRVLSASLKLAAEARIPTFVDPARVKLSVYAGATYIKPNLRQLSAATAMRCDTEENLRNAAQKVIAQTGAHVLVTRSEAGLSFFGNRDEESHVATSAMRVLDVSGAGDTVAAGFMVALLGGAAIGEAVRFANVAAGIAVGKPGTAVATADELAAAIVDKRAKRSPLGIVSDDVALDARRSWQEAGLKVGFTNGCFDLLHPGHIALLEQAAASCDRLIVAINTDASASRLKGPTRPVQSAVARARVVGAIAGVDLVVLFDQDTPLALIERLRPDLLVKGADYQESEIVGAAFVKSHGGKVQRIELIEGQSSTRLFERSRGVTS